MSNTSGRQPAAPPPGPGGHPGGQSGRVRPSGTGKAPQPQPRRPRCFVEVIDPDDVLVLSVNNRWHQSYTSNSHRYPLKVEIPQEFLQDGWNTVFGDYTNVALAGPRQEATVDYKVFVEDREVVHVTYQTEVEAQTFRITFRDSFSLRPQKQPQAISTRKASTRFDDLMGWSESEEGEVQS